MSPALEHPSQFAYDDPLTARLREICLAFPDTHEEETWGRPNFRVSKRIFAIAGAGQSTEASLWFKPDPEERRALLQQPAYFEPRCFGSKGWLALDLPDAGHGTTIDWQLIAELCDTSYRLIALKRQVAVLDARPA